MRIHREGHSGRPGIIAGLRFGLVIAVAYFLSGKLGLMFAPNEGYATAFFPAAGIALACVLIYGWKAVPWVFLGGLVLNLSHAYTAQSLSGLDVAAALGIACASTLQAILSAYLLRRFIAPGTAGFVLDTGQEAIRFVALASAGCVVSASLATAWMFGLNLITSESAGFSWLTWWVGDALGVLLTMPLTLTLIGQPQSLWRARRLPLGLLLGFGLPLVGGVVHYVSQLEREQGLVEFRLLSERVSEQLSMRMSEQEAFVDQLAAVMSGPNPISPLEFARMSREGLTRFHATMQAVEWAPRVTTEQRAAFERTRHLTRSSYAIKEKNAQGKMRVAGYRPEYVPVTYIEPLRGNESAEGYDLLSNPSRRATIESARLTDVPTATPPLQLVQERGRQQGLLLVHWVSGGSNGPGLVLVVLRMGDFMRNIVGDQNKRVNVRLHDVASRDEVIFDSQPQSSWVSRLSQAHQVSGGRAYRIETAPTPAYLVAHRNWQSWMVAVGGLVFLGMLSLSLMLASARRASIEALVTLRTAELESARGEAEQASKLLREAVSSIAQGFTIFDENDRLVLCNEAYRSFYSVSRDIIVPGNRFEQIVRDGALRGQYWEIEGDVEAWVRQRVAQHQNAHGEAIEQQLGDGRWLLIVEYRTPSGYIVGNRIDISEIKRTELALAESEQRWALSVMGANDGIWDWNMQTGALYGSERWLSMLGYAAADFGGRIEDWQALLHPEDVARTMAEMQRHLAGESEFYGVELRLRCKDGAYKWILCRGKAMFDAAGKPVRMSGSHTDISVRRAAEESVREQTEQLGAIFTLSPDGFVTFDARRCVKYVSPAFLRMTGLGEKEMIGLDEAVFSRRLTQLCLPLATFPGVAALRAAQNAGSGERGAQPGRRQLIEIAAAKRVLEVGLRLAEGEVVSQILYFRDVTHETEIDRMKSEFLSTAAHELRTPMANIYGYAELMLEFPLPEEDQRESLRVIFRHSERMVSIINELLDLARIESRRGKDFKLEHIDVGVLLNEVVDHFTPPDSRARPLGATGDIPVWVWADRGKLTQVLINVLANAYKYSPDGGPVEMELVESPATETAAGGASIRIIDHGIGMTPAQLERVCERFYRADASGRIPGTGLGMSIVKEIIELHGGEVALASQIGVGTTVTLWLPTGSALEAAES